MLSLWCVATYRQFLDCVIYGSNYEKNLFYRDGLWNYLLADKMPRLIALICKKPSISEKDFKTYYEKNHVPLIESLFPTLTGYKRTYLLEANMLNDALPLESDGRHNQLNVITELSFDDEEGLNQFFARGADQEVVDAIRKDEANFLDGEKTIMYRVE